MNTGNKDQDRQKTALLGLLAQTSVHAGAGQSVGVIDLPIQREGHNGWPCVFGSAMKGALRTKAEDIHGTDNDDLKEVFGPETQNSSDYASAIAVTDARLLLLPVRSLTSQFKWVTCPEALKRLQRDAELLGINLKVPAPEPAKEEAIVHNGSGDTNLFLEEYRFTTTNENLSDIIKVLANLMHRDDAKEVLEKQLVIVTDNIFSYLVKHAVPVNAHIAIDSATKIVKGGALWYEETLPPDTLLYLSLIASGSRKKVENGKDKKTASDILQFVTGLFDSHHWLQIGGNETLGMGWCGVKVYPPITKEEGQR